MAKKTPEYLRLHIDEAAQAAPSTARSAGPLAEICRSFEQATHWRMTYVSDSKAASETWSATVEGEDGSPAGRLVIEPTTVAEGTSAARPCDLEQARPLALAVARMLSENNRLKRAVWEREAELAAGVPVTARPDEEAHLAQRLTSVLKSGAESIGCHAAGLYLLDDTTSSLKLRAAYGLPQQRLLDDARPLRGAVADLEALVGHAVVLEDTSLLPHWRCPEQFPAAVCVPVSSPTMPLGTLWIFSKECRDFTSEQTNLVEIIAGRIAADLDREMLLTESTQARSRDRVYEAASRWQQDRLPSVAPLLSGWEVAGWTQQADALGGDFHDWAVLPDGRLAIAVADAHGTLVEAGLNAASLHAALKSHAGYRHDAAELLTRLSDTLWSGSAGDQFASLIYGAIEPASGLIEYALAGSATGLIVRREGFEILSTQAPPLGTGPECRYPLCRQELASGEILLLLSEGAAQAVDDAGKLIGSSSLASLVRKHRQQPAKEIATQLKRLLDRGPEATNDMTALVVKR
ncbi:MAG: GAF domain-containing SpoIIE family protein phosphatase, partial [Pirellulaceae bacterium]